MPARARRPLVWLRRLLLVALVLGVAGLGVVFYRGRVTPEKRGPGVTTPSGEITLVGQGFEYTQTDQGKKIFRIRGESVKVRQGSEVLLTDVHLTVWDEGGEPYEIRAKEAAYDQAAGVARLTGNVLLSGGQAIELAAEGIALRAGGNVIESTSTVVFRWGDRYAGRAGLLRLHRLHNFIQLAGDVRIDSLPSAEQPMALRAESVLLEGDQHLVRAEDRVELSRGGDLLRAKRLAVTLSEDDSRIVFARARWNVSGVLRRPGGGADAPAEATFRGAQLSVDFDEAGDPTSAEIESGPEGPAQLTTRDAAGLVSTLDAGYLTSAFRGGELVRVEAFGGAYLFEAPAGVPERKLREVRADRLDADFAGGELAAAHGAGKVEYRSAEAQVRGDRLAYDAATGKADLTGAPVEADSPRGQLRAPHVVFEEKAGVMSADGGVAAVLAEGSTAALEGSPLGGGEGPIRVEAKEALWRDRPRAFLFRGEVRAWRGESVLLAGALRGDGDVGAEVLNATGGVTSLWRAAEGESAAAQGGALQVTAGEMTYRRGERVVIYRQRVRAEQQARTLACDQLEATLDADGKAERMTCTGSVTLDDRAAGNTATGERAVYDLAARTMEITGTPVVLKKGDGARVQGPRVVYDLERGRATVHTDAPAPAEAEG